MSVAAPPPVAHDVEIRRLAEHDQVALLVRLHAVTFPRAESTRMGERYLTAWFDWYRATPSTVALLAWRDGALGYVLGSRHGSEPARYRKLFATAALAYLRKPDLWRQRDLWRMVRWRIASLGRDTARREVARLSAPTYVLDLIGVDPRQRQRGVAARLLEGFVDAARGHGARSLVLWVRRDATEARRLYERHGWREGWPLRTGRLAYVRDAEAPPGENATPQ